VAFLTTCKIKNLSIALGEVAERLDFDPRRLALKDPSVRLVDLTGRGLTNLGCSSWK